MFRTALALGAENLSELPVSETWLIELLTDAGDGGGSRGVTVGVVGGSGGAGASVFAGALGTIAARRGRTLLVDADPLGAGIDRVLGFEELDGIRWDSMMQATGRLSARSLRDALPHRAGLSVLTWPADRPATLQAFAMREVLSAGQRGHQTVILDLPRHPDGVVDEVLTRCDHVVLVSGVTVPAVASATRVAGRLPGGSTHTHLVTRGGRGGVDPSEVSRVLGVPLLAAMPDQRGLDEAVDLGRGPVHSPRGALARAARRVVDELLEPGGLAA